MKKIFLIFYSIITTTLFVLSVLCVISTFKVTEPKEIRSDEFRIVESQTIPENEQKFLDSTLKQNSNVLLLYYETDKELNSLDEKLIVGNYTKEKVPYVIFVYNPNSQILKTISSDKDILEFEDIDLENVTSYTEVYRHIPDIKSKLMVPMNSQNKDSLMGCSLMAILFLAFTFGMISIFFDETKRFSKWKEHSVLSRFLYKENFLETGYKVKNNPENEEVLAIYAKVPLVKEKDYFFIPKSKRKGLNEFILETESYVIVYKVNKTLGIQYDEICPKGKFIFEDYKYCLKNEKSSEIKKRVI